MTHEFDASKSQPFDAYHLWLGIPKREQPPHHYRLLSVSPFEEDPDVIANAADSRLAALRRQQSGPHAALCTRLQVLVGVDGHHGPPPRGVVTVDVMAAVDMGERPAALFEHARTFAFRKRSSRFFSRRETVVVGDGQPPLGGFAEVGANGIVMFNRFYQPDFDLVNLDVVPNLVLLERGEETS